MSRCKSSTSSKAAIDQSVPEAVTNHGDSYHPAVRYANLCLLIFNIMMVVLLVHRLVFQTPPVYQLEAIRASQDHDLLSFVHYLHRMLVSRNVSYFIGSSTLLGSACYYGPVPWIDEVSIFVNTNNRSEVEAALNSKQWAAHFRLGDGHHSSSDWTVYDCSERHRYFRFTFHRPFASLLFYDHNSSHVWHRRLGFHRISSIFPLKSRPFGKFSLNAPCNTSEVLGTVLNRRTCIAYAYDHLCVPERTEDHVRTVCGRLRNLISRL